MTTIKQALDHAHFQLVDYCDTPRLDAEVLLSYALSRSRSYLHAFPEVEMTGDQKDRFDQYVALRCEKVPIAYITGTKEFWSLNLKVTKDTLVPRPDTELLVETVLSIVPQESDIKIVDLGTGSGAIALALATQRPHWEVFAVDISDNALDVARHNAQTLGIDNISFYLGSWFTALPVQKYDVVVSNPPYVSQKEWEEHAEELKFEPQSALISGETGMDDINEILSTANTYVKAGGYLLIEHGYSQGQKVRAAFVEAGCKNIRTICDLAGLERITIGQF